MTYNWRPKIDVIDEQLFAAPKSWTPPQREVPLWQKPKELWGQAEEAIGEGVSKVPILPDVLKFVAPAFSWIHENLEKPFAAIVTSPFSPDIAWKQGESWVEHQKREYDAWEAPTYVKGVAEFAMPLWWMPWFTWAKAGAKALSVGGKTASALAKTGKALSVAEKGLPVDELLNDVLFRAGTLRSAMEHVPIVNKIVKMVGGEGTFITQKEAKRIAGIPVDLLKPVDALTKTKMELVKFGFLSDMRNGVKSILVPKLQVLEPRGGIAKLLGMDSKGVVTNIVDKSGKSQYLYDVLEGVIKNPENYKFLNKEVKQYVETLGTVLDDVYKLASKEGVKVPKEIFVHRIVKGKTTVKGYIESDYGSLFEKSRVHKLMKEGVELKDPVTGLPTPIDYGLDITESVSSTIDHFVREIARKRFDKAIGKLGKTPKDLWNALPEAEGIINPAQELIFLQASKVEGVLKQPEKLAQLIKLKKEFESRFKGSRQVFDEDLTRFDARLHPAFNNKLFPTEVSKTAEKYFADQSQKWLSVAANTSGTSRMLTAAMDLSAPFIQGAAVWGRNPLAWTKGVKNMFEFVWKPENYYKYLVSPEVSAIRMERIMAGGSSSTFEYFKALAPLQKQAGRIPVVGKGIQKGIAESWGRAETAFTGFGEVARNEMWKALRSKALGADGKLVDNLAMDLSRTIDRMTGVMSTEAIGIGRSQQDFENAFVFFAPRYTRAGLSFASDALKGGMAGAEARKALGSLMLSGSTFYYGAAKALGQQPDFNPNSSRFMTIKVGESHIGVGGIMTAMLRLAFDVGVTIAEDPLNLIKPLSEGSLNRWDNPFIKFLYSRTAPLTGLAVGAGIEQTNYFGEPLESVKDWANFMADKVTPIATHEIRESLIHGEEFPQPTTIAAEFGGLRVFPKSAWELLDEQKDEVSMREYQQPYDTLNDLDKMRIDKNDTVIKLQRDVDAQTVTRGDKESIAFINWERERNVARLTYENTLNDLQSAYDAGAIDGVEFRKKMSDAGYGLGMTYNHISEQPEYKSVMEVLAKPRKLDGKSVKDIAYAEFNNRIFTKNEQGRTEFEDQYGLFQYDKYNAFIAEFRAKWGEEVYEYVQDMKLERDANLPPMAKEYQKAKEVMKPYWDVEATFIKLFGKAAAETPRGKDVIAKQRLAIRQRNPIVERYYQLFYAQQ